MFSELSAAQADLSRETHTTDHVRQQEVLERALEQAEARRHRLESILGAVGVGAWETNLVTGETVWDERIGNILALAPEDAAGGPNRWAELIHPDDRPRAETALAAASETGGPVEVEFRVKRADGTERWVATQGMRVEGPDGVPMLVGLMRDITETKAAEARLREREERLQMIVDAMELGDFTFYPQTGRTEDSVYANRHLGLSPNASVDYPTFVRALHPADRDRVLKVVEHVLDPASGGQCPPTEYRTIGIEDGKERWLSVWVHVNFDAERKPVRFLGVTLDITERKRADEALEQANAKLREADHRKDEFLAVLSHELRNPLTPIRNSIYLLERATPGGEQANRARQVIDRQVAHMTRLVDDLLDVTRITRGKIVLQRERVDLEALVRKTAEDYQQVYLKNGVELEVEGAGELWVDGDRTRLAQIVGNLLSNSAKFTPRGGRTVVSVAEDAQGEAVIRVRDNGLGMTPATLQHLFEPFMQAEQTLDRSRGGLGLGLALVKGLIEMHGGKVTAHSEGEGKGSELTVTLPALTPAGRVLAGRPVPEPRTAVRHVLIIEDNEDAAESLRDALELGSHEVAIARSGREGIELARRYRPDVVLCDIGLPGLDGYGVARALRADADAGLRSTFLVALSGYAQQEDVARSKEAGFDRHMAKPPSIEELEKLLAEAPVRAAPASRR